MERKNNNNGQSQHPEAHQCSAREDKKKKLLTDMINDLEYKRFCEVLVDNPSFVSKNNKHQTQTNIHPAVERWFKAMDTKNEGRITSKELKQAFETFQGKRFSDSVCKFVVRLFDLDKNGGLNLKEFETLYHHIKQWVGAFNTYDRENSGYLDETELDFALKHLDINFSPEFIKFLVTRSNPMAKKLSMDQYIIACIQIQRFTDEFKSRDINYTGNINIKYEDFLEMIMRCL